jgi:WD40 repeat protein
VTALSVLPDGRVASGLDRGGIGLWNVKTGAKMARLETCYDGVGALAAVPDGRLVCSSSEDDIWQGTIEVFDLDSGTPVARIEGFDGRVWALAALPNGGLASSHDSTIKVWDLSMEPAKLEAHPSAYLSLPDGQFDEPTMRLSGFKSGTEPVRLEGHSSFVNALVPLLDGSLASGADDNTVRLWDLQTGALKATLEGHGGPVQALAVLSNGRLASASHDATIRIWDIKSAAEVARLQGHRDAVFSDELDQPL